HLRSRRRRRAPRGGYCPLRLLDQRPPKQTSSTTGMLILGRSSPGSPAKSHFQLIAPYGAKGAASPSSASVDRSLNTHLRSRRRRRAPRGATVRYTELSPTRSRIFGANGLNPSNAPTRSLAAVGTSAPLTDSLKKVLALFCAICTELSPTRSRI